MAEDDFDSKYALLFDSFPETDSEVIMRALCESDGDLHNAFNWILAHNAGLEDEEFFDAYDDYAEFVSGSSSGEWPDEVYALQMEFPTVDGDYLHQFYLLHSHLDIVELVRLLKEQLELHENTCEDLTTFIPVRKKARVKRQRLPLSTGMSPTPTFKFVDGSRGMLTDILEILLPDDDSIDLDEIINSEKSAEELRKEADSLLQEIRDLFNRVSRSNASSGAFSSNPIAQFYFTEVSSLKRRRDRLQLQAALRTFMEKNPNLGDPNCRIVDLHGLTVKEALKIAEYLLQRESWPLSLVTGKGKHSQSGAKLRPAIYDFLRSRGVTFRVESSNVFIITSSQAIKHQAKT